MGKGGDKQVGGVPVLKKEVLIEGYVNRHLSVVLHWSNEFLLTKQALLRCDQHEAPWWQCKPIQALSCMSKPPSWSLQTSLTSLRSSTFTLARTLTPLRLSETFTSDRRRLKRSWCVLLTCLSCSTLSCSIEKLIVFYRVYTYTLHSTSLVITGASPIQSSREVCRKAARTKCSYGRF